MIKVGDLIRDTDTGVQTDCELTVGKDTSVREVLCRMHEYDCDCVRIETGDGESVVLTKQDVLQGVLTELDGAQDLLIDLHGNFDGESSDQSDLIEEGIKTVVASENNKLEVAIANMTEGLIILDQQGRVERANPSAKKLLGLGFDDDLNSVSERIDEFGLRELLVDTDGDNNDREGEFIVKAPSGKILRMRWTAIIDELGNSNVAGHVVMIRDVTDEIAAEKTKTEFIAAISHELRTPITSIQNSVSNMLAGVTGRVNKKMQKYLYAMKDDCHRSANLVNDLLDIAKLETGNMPMNRGVMNMVTAVRSAVDEFADQAGVEGIKLSYETEGYIPPLYADSQRVSQVLWNLLSNAIKFTGKDGTVAVKCWESEDKIFTMVEDTGVGISPDKQKEIFSKFYQISRQAGPGYKGTGLGLAICKGIIAAHGGMLWVESEETKGSKFYFSLPKTDAFIVLRKHLAALSQRPGGEDNGFALLVTKFDVPDGKESDLKNIIGSLTNKLLIDSAQFLTAEEDIAIQMADFEVFFVVSNAEKQHIEMVEREIEKIVHNWLRNNCGDAPILPMCGVAVYPTDSCDVRDLEKIARLEAGKMF